MRLLPPETYQNPGKQDLTFDVLFPDLVRWGAQLGFETVLLTTQADFLNTQDEDGAGRAFKIIHQHKDSYS